MAMVYDLDKAEAEVRAGCAATRALPNLDNHGLLQVNKQAEDVHVAFMRWSMTCMDDPGRLPAAEALLSSMIKGIAAAYGEQAERVEAVLATGIMEHLSEPGSFIKSAKVEMTKRDVGDA